MLGKENKGIVVPYEQNAQSLVSSPLQAKCLKSLVRLPIQVECSESKISLPFQALCLELDMV